ncbi:MAG: phenylphosphate carboxylase subunit delta, partial [Nitrospirae bacterium]
LDVDGVLTDGRIVYDSAGAEAKAFHVRDGQRIKLAIRHGLAFGIITGRSSEVVRRRAAELGIAHVHQGAKRKLPVLEALLGETGLDPEAVAYVGDDIVDLPVMRRVGWAVAVADAPEAVRAHAHWVTRSPGGRGAVAEVVERILEAKGLWQEILEEYLR